ncbi:hypothetical protein RRG08_012557 [Elysia crispata]|uniref:Uncharacterized protein n=1 Tax=Elysia crispata TaxID=231223 RepID=A0AAE1AP06_9GAST|nr:hypothetical protein RRG08_012557 [Elysia crispata]
MVAQKRYRSWFPEVLLYFSALRAFTCGMHWTRLVSSRALSSEASLGKDQLVLLHCAEGVESNVLCPAHRMSLAQLTPGEQRESALVLLRIGLLFKLAGDVKSSGPGGLYCLVQTVPFSDADRPERYVFTAISITRRTGIKWSIISFQNFHFSHTFIAERERHYGHLWGPPRLYTSPAFRVSHRSVSILSVTPRLCLHFPTVRRH